MPGLDRMVADMEGFVRLLGGASPGATVVECDGVVASVVPASPERSVFNSVVYRDHGALAAALPELAEAYESAGVRAWTVWTPEEDRRSAELLESRDHRLDGVPLAMEAELTSLELAGVASLGAAGGELAWTADGRMEEVGLLNDAAYPVPTGSFPPALRALAAGARAYVASIAGEPASCVVTLEREGSCGVYFVATRPQARGRGLASALLSQALIDARERGCRTATLQATRMGSPIYERLGFRSLGVLQMWERRREK